MRLLNLKRTTITVLLLLIASACSERHSPIERDAASEEDAPSSSDAGPAPPTSRLDLVFVIDSGASLAQERSSLSAQLPEMFRALATGDLDGDGSAEATAFGDLHVAIATADLGVGRRDVPTCTEYGDEGAFFRDDEDQCGLGSAPFRRFDAAGDSIETFGDNLRCLALEPSGGCGFEQALESMLLALSPARATEAVPNGYRPPAAVHEGYELQGDGTNDGFLRPDSVLAIVHLTDEDDCSAEELELFDPSSEDYPAESIGNRCIRHPGALRDIDRYVDGLLALRPWASRVVYSVIAGVPPELTDAGGDDDYEAVLSHPSLLPLSAEEAPREGCSGPAGPAQPPIRLVQVAEELEARGARATVQSTCDSDGFGAAFRAIVLEIGNALDGER